MATAKKPNNFFRGPWFWVLLAALILFPLVGTLTTGSSGRVDTNVGLQLLREGQVAEAKIYDVPSPRKHRALRARTHLAAGLRGVRRGGTARARRLGGSRLRLNGRQLLRRA